MLILVSGGSGSGKSEFAEALVLKLHQRPCLYIATMVPFDEECRQRIAKHRRMRADKGFETLECYLDLKNQDVTGYGTVLLECMSNLTANELYQEGGSKDQCVTEILAGIKKVYSQCTHLIVVTNEIFSDGIVYEEETQRYQACLGQINQKIAALADLVVEVVYSIPVVQKGTLDCMEKGSD